MAASARQVVPFEFSPEAYARLNEITKEANYRDRAETIRNGLRVLEWILARKKEGCSIRLVKPDGKVIELDPKTL